MKKTIYNISRYLLGALFLFSGFAKSVNPFGLSIQFGDYFAAMSLDFLIPYSQYFAVALPVAEMLLGAMLILGLYRYFTAWAVSLFMTFFTLLTLWIALYNPVKDCGCFGDLIILSNWATFFKNVAFLIPTLIIFNGRNEKQERRNWRVVTVLALLFAVLPVYTFSSLPIIDATPYKIGTNIWKALNDGEADQTDITLIYRDKSTGKEREFSVADPEWQDMTRWEYVDTKTKTIKKGNEATIAYLPMIDATGADKAEEVLTFDGRTTLIVASNPQQMMTQLANVVAEAKLNGAEHIVMLHSALGTVEITGIDVYSTDQTTLRTIIQNPRGGVIVLEDGIIIEKRAF